MLRTLLVALIAANLLFFTFTRGWFDGLAAHVFGSANAQGFGLNSLGDREPERLAAQVRPESIRLLPPFTPASAAATAALSCFEAGPFTTAESAAVESTLRTALAAGAWVDSRSDGPGPAGTAVVSHVYRVAAADGVLAARLATLRLDASGRSFVPCRAERR